MTSERRAHPRHLIEQEGVFFSESQPKQACRIENFCQSGLFITYDFQEADLLGSSVKPLAVGDTILVEFSPGGSNQAFQIKTEVKRVDTNAMGLHFLQHQPEAVQALFQIASGGFGVNSNNKTRKPELLALCRQGLSSFLNNNLDKINPAIVDALLLRASKAINNEEEQKLFDLVKKLKAYPEKLGHSFKKHSLKFFDQWAQDGEVEQLASQAEENSGLSLIAKDDFEHWLVGQIVINKSMQKLSESLYRLSLCMEDISAHQVNDKNNPLNPSLLGQAFYQSIQPLKLSSELTQVFFEGLEDVIFQSLDSFYESLTEELIKAGANPEAPKVVKSDEASPQEKADEQTSDTLKAVPAQNTVNNSVENQAVELPTQQAQSASAGDTLKDFFAQQKAAQQAFSTVQELLALQTTSKQAGSAPANAATGPRLADDEIISALNHLQTETFQSGERLNVASLSERLNEALGDRMHQLPEEEKTAIGLTENLVGSMLCQNTLADQFKPRIKQLEVPLLKIMRQDDQFFENENHPARQVFNRLGQLGMKGTVVNKAMERNIESIVNRVTQEFDQNLDVFNDVLTDLNQLTSKHNENTQRNTRRVVEAAEGFQTVDKAKHEVAQLIDENLGGKEVPNIVVELIDKAWRELLIFVLLRDGKSSAQWKSYARVVEVLGGLTAETLVDKKTTKKREGLLKLIQTGLKDSSQNRNQSLYQQLRSVLIEGDEHETEFVLYPKGMELDADLDSGIDEKMLEDKAFKRWVKRAKRLQVSDWVERLTGKEAMPMRLAWAAEEHAKFVFVNHQGMKVVELTLQDVAESLQGGTLWPIAGDAVPFVDQAIDQMIQGIYDQMDTQAKHDELTGCSNRKHFERQLEVALSHCKRLQNKHTVLFINLDQFKAVNNACGKSVGDELLKAIATIISDKLPDGATVARFSGDEFGVIIENCYEAKGRGLAQGILESIQAYRHIHEEKHYTVGASIGLVVVDEAWQGIDLITSAADSALTSAKEGGRNRVHVYVPDDKDQAERDKVMDKIVRLNKALDEDRLQLRCQKIQPIDPQAGVKPHYEVLLSVEDEEGLHLAPSDFIHAAERYNRMQAVDRWVIRNVFKWMSEHRSHLADIGGFTINLSGQSLNDESLLSYVFDELVSNDIPREQVCFEVTETTAVASLAAAADFINEMKTLGFRFALDDFGSGLSSYRYLKNLPVDYVKIDGAFVKDMNENISDFAMVKSINELGHMMGKKTVAEYVENQAIYNKLAEIGVDYAQGYYVDKPQPIDNILTKKAA